MKLKLLAPGYTDYTGLFGIVEFENGLSVEDVSEQAANRIACIVSAAWEDGGIVGVADRLLAGANVQAPDMYAKREEIEYIDPTGKSGGGAAWTKEELGEIADKNGIAGLREIGEPAGVKGNSIVGLIDAIVAANVTKEA